jgi:hypothetical protein
MAETPHGLRIFLCHSSGDKPAVRHLYQTLNHHTGFKPWLDEVDLVAGQDWELEIRKAVKKSDVIIVCLSNDSINKRGFVQKEIKYALDVADEQPEGTIFLIPLRLEECEVPDRLSSKHWVDYFRPDGYERLLYALRKRAQELGIEIPNTASSKGRQQKPPKRDWNNPQVACSLLSHIRDLQTGGYKSSGIEDDFFCCSPYKDLNPESVLSNHIAYYAEGDAEQVQILKLILSVLEPQKAEEAHGVFMTYSNELALKALGEALAPKMKEAILAGRPEAYMVEELFVELKREAWPTGRGYDMKFIITQPII